MIVDAGAREERDVERVIGMVVGDHDIGDLGRLETERPERIQDGRLARCKAGVDDDRHLAIADEAARAGARRTRRAGDEQVEASGAVARRIGHHGEA